MSGKCIKTGKSRKRNAVKYLPLLWERLLYQFGGILGIAFICYIVYNTLALYPWGKYKSSVDCFLCGGRLGTVAERKI